MSLLEGIAKIASKYKNELVGLTRVKIITHLNLGTYLVKGSSFLLWSKLSTKSYLGVACEKDTIHLEYIASGVKGKGEATLLLDTLKGNQKPIVLLVRQDNTRAIAFYKKHGFKEARVVEYKNFNSVVMLWSAET